MTGLCYGPCIAKERKECKTKGGEDLNKSSVCPGRGIRAGTCVSHIAGHMLGLTRLGACVIRLAMLIASR